MSNRIMVANVVMPAPPMPYTVRPASSRWNSLATQPRIVPTLKKLRDIMSASWRPKISKAAPMKGRKTAFASRYDVPF